MRIFEFSFEVCNKVGGIYTVVSSKAALTTHEFEDYWCVGPMIGNGPSQREFTPSDVPDKFIEPFEKLIET